MMETTFGLVLGFVLGLGLWLGRTLGTNHIHLPGRFGLLLLLLGLLG